jgi:hypothetical protein
MVRVFHEPARERSSNGRKGIVAKLGQSNVLELVDGVFNTMGNEALTVEERPDKRCPRGPHVLGVGPYSCVVFVLAVRLFAVERGFGYPPLTAA